MQCYTLCITIRKNSCCKKFEASARSTALTNVDGAGLVFSRTPLGSHRLPPGSLIDDPAPPRERDEMKGARRKQFVADQKRKQPSVLSNNDNEKLGVFVP